MTPDEARLMRRLLPIVVILGILIGLLPGDNIWVPVH